MIIAVPLVPTGLVEGLVAPLTVVVFAEHEPSHLQPYRGEQRFEGCYKRVAIKPTFDHVSNIIEKSKAGAPR